MLIHYPYLPGQPLCGFNEPTFRRFSRDVSKLTCPDCQECFSLLKVSKSTDLDFIAAAALEQSLGKIVIRGK